MSDLLRLPDELKVAIIHELIAANKLPSGLFTHNLLESLAALSRSCRWLHQYVNPILYLGGVQRHPYLLIWATETQNIGCMRKLLEAGAEPNAALSCSPRRPGRKNPDTYHSMEEFFKERYSLAVLCANKCSSEQGGAPGTPLDCLIHEARFNPSDLWMRRWNPKRIGNFTHTSDFPITLATAAGNLEAVYLLIEYGADLKVASFRNDLCHTDNARLHIVRCEKAEGALYRAKIPALLWSSSYVWTPLHFALCHGNDELAKHFISLDDSIREHFLTKLETEEGPIPLFITAVKHQRFELADYILSTGIESVHADYGKRRYGTLLWQAYWQGGEALRAALPILLKYGADVDADVGIGHTLLVEACIRAHYDEAQMLLDAGANANVQLLQLSRHSIAETGDILLGYLRCRKGHSANYDHQPCLCGGDCLHGRECKDMSKHILLYKTPIYICVQGFYWCPTSRSFGYSKGRICPDNAPIFKELLLRHPKGAGDRGLLIFAASTHQPKLVTILLDAGASPNAQDYLGNSLLKNVINRGWKDLGAVADIAFALGQQAKTHNIKLVDCDWAILRLSTMSTNRPDVVKAIEALSWCGNINARDNNQNTVLTLAFGRNDIVSFNQFLKMGATLGKTQRQDGLPVDDLELMWEQLLQWRHALSQLGSAQEQNH